VTADPGRLLTAEQVAEMLAVPASWVYSESRAGRVPCVRLGRYRRYRQGAIQAWLEAHETGAPPSRQPGGSAHGTTR
jgi:excisionase family DNA binding protein